MHNPSSSWRSSAPAGVWRHGPKWAKPFVAAAPWIAFAIVLGAIALAQDRLTAAPGTLFSLPEGTAKEGRAANLVALVLPHPARNGADAGTMVFFDDARYILSDPSSRDALSEAVSARAAAAENQTLLAMVDTAVPAGELMDFVHLARAAGISLVQVAEKPAPSK